MALNKLKIKNMDNGDTFEVLFNPSEYTLEGASKWQDQQGNRRPPELQYTGGERKKLSMDLFFDTYEDQTDVRQYTSKFAKLLVVTLNDSNTGKRPPKLQLSWGNADPATGFPFVCVLETLRQQFTMFSSDGTPVRAKLSVTFKEFELPKDDEQRDPRRQSFPAQTYTVRDGDTLSGIASILWQDPTQWRLIAQQNQIDNPRMVVPGEVLIVPAIED